MTRPDRSVIRAWLRVVAITPDRWDADETVAFARAVVEGGATAVLVRERRLDDDARLDVTTRIAAACRSLGAVCLVSRDVDIARAAGADAVHTGFEGPSVAEIHAAGLVAGRSAHWPLVADDTEADYVTLSPFAETHRSHTRPLLTNDQIAAALTALDAPVCALGGITFDTLDYLPEGLAGVAVIRALSDAPDPRSRAAELRSVLDTQLDFGGAFR